MALLVIHGTPDSAPAARISAQYTAGAAGAGTGNSRSRRSAASAVVPLQTVVVKPSGALLRTRSSTGPDAVSSSPSRAVPAALLAVNSNAVGVAAPSTAV